MASQTGLIGRDSHTHIAIDENGMIGSQDLGPGLDRPQSVVNAGIRINLDRHLHRLGQLANFDQVGMQRVPGLVDAGPPHGRNRLQACDRTIVTPDQIRIVRHVGDHLQADFFHGHIPVVLNGPGKLDEAQTGLTSRQDSLKVGRNIPALRPADQTRRISEATWDRPPARILAGAGPGD